MSRKLHSGEDGQHVLSTSAPLGRNYFPTVVPTFLEFTPKAKCIFPFYPPPYPSPPQFLGAQGSFLAGFRGSYVVLGTRPVLTACQASLSLITVPSPQPLHLLFLIRNFKTCDDNSAVSVLKTIQDFVRNFHSSKTPKRL